MRRAALLGAAAALVAACQTIPRLPDARATDEAHVSALGLKFPREGEGLCTVELMVPGRPAEDGAMGDLVWELWLEGHPFAAGVARPELALQRGQWGKATLSLPLVYRSASWTADARSMRVRFKGRLERRFGVDAPATEIDEQRVVVSDGAVLFDRGGGPR
jgi:hypothetical protein